jgi:predicted O-linked N-acetylglucosamine transferase (SPINDLY family)
VVNPFTFQQFSDDPADQLACARMYALRELIPAAMTRRSRQPSGAAHDRIRIGYLSADFRDHPVAHLIVGLIESHDRNRFEVAGISLGVNDSSEVRARFEASFDHFIDLDERQDDAVMRRIDELKLDILVDLVGYTLGNWMAAFAYGFAPIQVNYLGYAGTTGVDLFDYILVDPFVVPADQQPFYSEKLVHLPDAYQPNDPKRAIAERTPTRAECGLPENGFVFAMFNNSLKITPRVFDVWMRLLRAVPGSVLWIFKASELIEQNLRREAEARGIDSGRLVFAPRIPLADHLARHRLADLFLDTFPYTAHTTASDALWAGLPVVTCAGKTFPARVAGSLLRAIGLPDLVTSSFAEYEALAFKLATDPAKLKDARERLKHNRDTMPLFNLDRFRRHIEAAYTIMWERYQRGKPPASFAVDPID